MVVAALLSGPKKSLAAGEDGDPVITAQPASQTIEAGKQVAIKVSATSAAPPLHYQWYKDGEPQGGNADLIYFAAAAESDAGTYHVVLKDGAGETTSEKAVLTVTKSEAAAPAEPAHPRRQEPPGPNLIVNGGFEDGMKSWGYEEWDHKPVPGVADGADKNEGGKSFQMGLPGSEGGRWIAQEIPLKDAGHDYILSFALKLKGVPEGSARVRLGVEGRGFLNYGDLVRTGGDFDWKTFKFAVTDEMVGDAKKVTLFFYDDNMGKGTIGIDGVSFAAGTLEPGQATPQAVAFGYTGVILTGDTNSPEISTFALGQPVELVFVADGLSGVKGPLSLELSIVDEHGRQIDTKKIPVQPDANGHWQTKVDAPRDRLGFYRVYARLSNNVPLHALGTRPAGFLTYIVVPDPAGRPDYGEDRNYFGMQGTWHADICSLLGVRWTLDDSLFWKRMEPDRAGQFGPAEVKQFVAGPKPGDASFRVDALPTLFVAPEWAVKPGTLAYETGALTPEGEKAWAEYCQTAARAFAAKYPERKKHVYQITWEPIRPWGFKGTDADLVRIYEIAHRALHEADPNAIVAGPCRGIWNNGDPQDTIRLLKMGLGRYLDGYTVHPYFTITPERDGMPQTIRTIREALKASCGKDVPMYGTEQGWATDEDVSKEVLQAQGLLRQNLITMGEGFRFNLAFTYYDYRMGGSRTGYGYYYNLIEGVPFGPGKVCPKPIAAAFAAQSMLLEGSESLGAIEWLGQDVWGYAFERNGETTLALWNYGDQSRDVTLPAGVKEVRLFDWMGNARTIATDKGQLTLKQLGPEPVYVAGVSSTMWGSEANKVLQMERKKFEVYPGDIVTISGTVRADGGGTLRLEPGASAGLAAMNQTVAAGAKEGAPFQYEIKAPPAAHPGTYAMNLKLTDSAGNTVTATALALNVLSPLEIGMDATWTGDGKPALVAVITDRQGRGSAGKLAVTLKEFLPGAQRSAAPNIDEVADPGKTKDVPGASQEVAFAVPAGGSQRLVIPFPDAVLAPARPYQALATVTTAEGTSFSQNGPVHFLRAEHQGRAPVIDGDLSDWPPAAPVELAGPRDVIRSPQYFPANLSAQVRFAWDAQNLYLAATVNDPAFVQTKTGVDTWSQDCLQLAFNLDAKIAGDSPQAGERRTSEITVALTPKGPEAYRTLSSAMDRLPSAALNQAQCKLAIKKTGSGLIYEVAIPWKTLGLKDGEKFAPGDAIGVALTVNDVQKADQGDPSALGLFGGITPDKNPDKQGTLILQ